MTGSKTLQALDATRWGRVALDVSVPALAALLTVGLFLLVLR
jgi:hypothetical protein